MSVTSHLKDLLIKMGGTPKNGDSTSVLIDKIEDVYAGGSGGSSGGNSGAMVVSIYLDRIEDTSDPNQVSITGYFKTNKTYREIYNAYKNGSIVEFRYISCPTSMAVDPDFSPDPGAVFFVPEDDNVTPLLEAGHTSYTSDHIIMSKDFYERYKPSDEMGTVNTYECCYLYKNVTFLKTSNGIPANYGILINFSRASFKAERTFECNSLDDYLVSTEYFEFQETT